MFLECITDAFYETLESGTAPMRGLGTGRRLLALVVVAFGMGTFFQPLILTNPAVMGRSRWSAWTIARELHAGHLPHSATQGVGYIPPDVALTYVALLLALGAICFVPAPRLLAAIAFFGGVAVCNTPIFDFNKSSFLRLFYGTSWSPPGSGVQVDFHQLTIAALVVMTALFLIALDAIWDTRRRKPRPTEVDSDGLLLNARTVEILESKISPRGTAQGPEFIDAEVLPPERKVKPPQ